MAVDELWVAAIHEGLMIATGAAIAECARAKGGDPLLAVRQARAAVDKSVAGITITGTQESGAKVDLSPELVRRMAKLLDEAEQKALKELGLSAEGQSVQ